MPIRILLADDHQILREGLRMLLEQAGDVQVAGEAATGREAVRLAAKLAPAVVVMDISMPDLNGIEATRQILDAQPGAKIIILSMHSDRRLVEQVLLAGAMGYLLREAACAELVQAVRTVLRNDMYLSPALVRPMVEGWKQSRAAARGGAAASLLSAREREVLQLLAEGQSTKQIAACLFVSAKTVETHRLQLMKKLKLSGIAALTKFALREGLTSLD